MRPDGVAVVGRDPPGEPVSTLGPTFPAEVGRVLDEVARRPALKAAILVLGEADGVFAGPDLAMLQALSTATEASARCRAGQAALLAIAASPRPIVAAVHGAAVGGAGEVALACHGRVLSDERHTALAFPEVQLGVLPALDGLPRLAAKVGLRIALDHGLTGAGMSAARAAELGVADRVVPFATLQDGAAALALRLAAASAPFTRSPARRRSITELALERNPLGRRLFFRQARAALLKRTGGHYPAPERILDLLQLFAEDGVVAAREAQAQSFGELVMSSAAQRLIELAVAEAAASGTPTLPVTRLLVPLLNEAGHLLAEGVSLETIERALIAWGWRLGPARLLGEVGLEVTRVDPRLVAAARARRSSPPDPGAGPALAAEEIQMRCSLQLVNEALRCLGEGLLASPREGDLGAVRGLGFPRFRGGPFRYVDATGADEVLRRIEGYQRQLGPRFTPAPLLVELSRGRTRLYP